MKKRGQISIFVIVAIAIVAIILVLFLFQRADVFVTEVNPSTYLRDCVEPQTRESIEILSRQGGYFEPSNYITYQDDKVQYLCYTAQNYEPCIVQQPLLVEHVKKEIRSRVEPRAQNCVNELVGEYEKRGFEVQTRPGEVNVDLIPGKINVEFNSPITVSKESTQTFQKFSVGIDSEWYDLLSTATSILQFESTLGDSETLLYVQYYPDLKIEKIKREGSTIYKLSNVVTGDKFTFATRSLVWPQGYGFEEIS